MNRVNVTFHSQTTLKSALKHENKKSLAIGEIPLPSTMHRMHRNETWSRLNRKNIQIVRRISDANNTTICYAVNIRFWTVLKESDDRPFDRHKLPTKIFCYPNFFYTIFPKSNLKVVYTFARVGPTLTCFSKFMNL